MSTSLIKLISRGSKEDYDFVLSLLRKYSGEPEIHEVIKELIQRLPVHSKRLNQINICLDNTEVVIGEFGYVEAYRKKIAELSTWHKDPRSKIRNYATKRIRHLEQKIANAQRSAEMDMAIRKRDYGVDTSNKCFFTK